ncbi:MAG: spermidine synthase, partial [Acidobacteria bacterium]
GGRVPAPLPAVLAAAALAGFAFLLMELVWYRMLAPLLGGSSYTFGLILAVALLGIGAGGLLYAAGEQRRRPTLAAFGVTCGLEALLLIVPFALGDRLAILAMLLRPLGDAGFALLTATWALITALVVLPPALVAGYQFPLLVAVLGSGRRDVGRQVGLAYAWNTAGGIAGSIAGGFGLMPLLTAPGVWRTVAALLAALALAAVVAGRRQRPPRRQPIAAVALAAAAVALLLLPGPSAFWRHTPIGAGRMPARFPHGPNELTRLIHEHRREIVWEVDGVESSVAVEGQAQYIFLINGKADGSALRDAPNMVMSVLIGGLLHPAPKRALVIGLGSGLSAGWLAEIPSIERVDVVELEPAVAHVARLCHPVNHRVLDHPKVELITGDGREFLLTTGERYDLIFSQPSNPYRAGIASLFSQEFYRAVARRLAPGGMLLQWLQGYEVDAQVVSMAYATLGSVLPAIESWQVHANDLLLVAGRQPPVHDLERLRARVEEEPYASALDLVWGVEGLDGLYAGYLATPRLARSLRSAPINTDDHPRMEFGFVRNLGREGLFFIDDLAAAARLLDAARPPLPAGALDPRRLADLRAAREVAWGSMPLLPPDADPALARRIQARRAYRQGDLRRAFLLWSQQPEPPQGPLDRLLLADAGAELADPRTPERIQALGPRRPVEADAVGARFALRSGRTAAAAERLEAVFRASRDYPWTYPPVLARALELAVEVAAADAERGRALYDALSEPFSVHLVEELRQRTRVRIARRLGDPRRCAAALHDFEPSVPWEGRFLLDRFRCYQAADDPLKPQAAADLERFLAAAPPRLERGLLPQQTAGGGP